MINDHCYNIIELNYEALHNVVIPSYDECEEH
jgi:hypothetical protein